MTSQQALEGVHVLEIGSGVAGPYGGRLLSDFGAEVVKLEHPDAGDFARRVAPVIETEQGPRSVLFEYLNAGKKSVTLDLAASENQSAFKGWVEWADIVLISLRPGSVERLNLVPAIREWNSQAAVTLVSNFGQSGPYRDWKGTDLIFQAMGGVMQISGTGDREPLKPGLNQSLYCAGMNAAYASVAALIDARRTGAGPTVDLSILECVASALVMNEPYYAFLGAIQGRRPAAQDPLSGEAVPARNGFVSLQATTLAPVAGFSEVFDDPRFALAKYATEAGRTEHAEEFARLLDEHLSSADPREVFEKVCSKGMLAGFVQASEQLLTCPQLEARDFWWENPGLTIDKNPIRFPWKSVELSGTPLTRPNPAPALGADNGVSPTPRTAKSERVSEPEPRGGPLAGLRVVDLSTVFAVPYMGALLSDLGADVIKVEPPARLDQTRSSFGASFDNEPGEEYWNRASTFQTLNRGKQSIVLDLHTERGRELFLDLVRDADVLLDNFTPRVMRKWGTTFEVLSQVNPRLVMLSNTGYGSTGPWSSFKAQGTTLEATMGLTAVTGYSGGGPMKAGQSYPDFLACWTGMLAVLSALVARDETGVGQWIDLGMYQLGATVIPEAVLGYQIDGREVTRRGTADVGTVLSGVFLTKEADTWIAVSVERTEQLLSLADVAPEVAQVAAAANLVENESSGIARLLLGDWIRSQRPADAVSQLQAAGVAAGLVANSRDLIEDPQLRSRGFYEWLEYPGMGRRPLIGRPFRWHPTGSVRIRSLAPLFAEDNERVLEPLAGSADEYRKLLTDGVTATAPVNPPTARPLPLHALVKLGALALNADFKRHLDELAPTEM